MVTQNVWSCEKMNLNVFTVGICQLLVSTGLNDLLTCLLDYLLDYLECNCISISNFNNNLNEYVK